MQPNHGTMDPMVKARREYYLGLLRLAKGKLFPLFSIANDDVLLLCRFHEWPIFTSTDFRFTQNANALFATAMAWSVNGSFLIKSWNSTEGDGKRITAVSLVGSKQNVSYNVRADGMCELSFQ